jgi:hypothetical protein
LRAAVEPQFLALRVLPEPCSPVALDRLKTPSQDKRSTASDGMIEIVLPDGVIVVIIGEVEDRALQSVLGVLRG